MALPAPEWISFEAEKTEGLDLLGRLVRAQGLEPWTR